MTLQEQLWKLTTGGPGVTHIAAETLFEDCAKQLDYYEVVIAELRTEIRALRKAEEKPLAGEAWRNRIRSLGWRKRRL